MQTLGGYSPHQSLGPASAGLGLTHFGIMKSTGDINLKLIQWGHGGEGDWR